MYWTWSPFWPIRVLGKGKIVRNNIQLTCYSPVDKARLLMLYIIWKEGGIFEDDKRKLMEHAQLSSELRDAINNLSLLGVKLTRMRGQEKSSSVKKRRDRKRDREEEQPYELSRYVPVLKKVMESHLNNNLDENQFGYTKQSEKDPVEEGGAPSVSGVSLRTTKTNWAKKSNSIHVGQNEALLDQLLIILLGFTIC